MEERLIFALAKNEHQIITTLFKEYIMDWSFFFALLVRHKIAPFILDRLLNQPLSAELPEFFKKICKKEIAQALIDNQIIRRDLSCIKKVLDQEKITFVLLKGLTLNRSQLRTMGDLDILVKEADLLKAIRVLRAINYFYSGDRLNMLLSLSEKNNINKQMDWNNQFQLTNEASGLCLELHINLFEKKRAYQEDLSAFWAHPDIIWAEKVYNPRLQCFQLSSECLLLLMCLHVAIKRSPANQTFILRNVLDIEALVQTNPDWNKVYELAVRFNVKYFLYFALLLSKKLMKITLPASVLARIKTGLTAGELFMIRLHLRIFKNLHSFSTVYTFVYKLLRPFLLIKSWRVAWKARIRSLLIFPGLFPPRWRMAYIYNLSKTSALLAFTYLLFPVQTLYRYCRSKIIK